MKMLKKLFRKPIGLLGSFLILIAPLIITKSACISFWGEPECPECLLQDK